jgi:hypothetical protein
MNMRFLYVYLRHEPSGDVFVYDVPRFPALRDTFRYAVSNLANSLRKAGRFDVTSADARHVVIEFRCDPVTNHEIITSEDFIDYVLKNPSLVSAAGGVTSTGVDGPLCCFPLRSVTERNEK